ncbi:MULTISPECIES: hypothetical protein [Mesorhizobium]|uniref:Uncharacterized protein n=1 Tax=Rhizobium loti TaxID=381 RepID=A0A1A5I9P9_RHILI|nr:MULTISPECIES: hypothetical protein [Mesorhizobium]ETA72176.1 hypothetical protein MesloDRAFT_1039 [Mesorhizobium japonicum R7A]OBP75572.1 hypothetical protein BAE42_08415 [Mesorhizobium loti]OBP76986.1 hypothetical protein BAE39_13085 [Mesorhizobium loti]OBP81921.1 hypothetical protein BAE41_09725 [Mesorhizobium loti]OBP90617.1 hypothetical protein BAE40_17535 [Mesorhizobium loti]
MQFFALLTRNTAKFADADFAPLLPGEAEQRRTLYAEGAVRQVWHDGDRGHRAAQPLPRIWAEALSCPDRDAVAVKAPSPRSLLDTL